MTDNSNDMRRRIEQTIEQCRFPDGIAVKRTAEGMDNRPFYLRVSGRCDVRVLRAIREMGLVVVGVTHMGEHTNVHVADQ